MSWKPQARSDEYQILAKQRNLERAQALKENSTKVENYAKYVKEMYWPKASVRKQLELEQLKINMKHQPVRKSEQDASPEKKAGAYRGWRNSVQDNAENLDYTPGKKSKHHSSQKGIKHDNLS